MHDLIYKQSQVTLINRQRFQKDDVQSFSKIFILV